MRERLNSVDELQTYLTGVINNARDHAPEVEEVIFALVGALILEKDSGVPLQAGTYRGRMANVLRATIRSEAYVFSYDHDNGQIIIKRGNQQGPVVGQFSNRTSIRSIIRIFRNL